jgi:hypothetical protein
MGCDFTVIMDAKHHFGDERSAFSDMEPGVVFGTVDLNTLFDCPNVDPLKTAVLMFQSLGVTTAQRDMFQVNRVNVRGDSGSAEAKGGLPASPNNDEWNGNIQLLDFRHGLKERNNILTIGTRNTSGETGGDEDDFMIDNVVIMYKTRSGATIAAAPSAEQEDGTV